MDAFIGTWKLCSSKNYGNVLRELGFDPKHCSSFKDAAHIVTVKDLGNGKYVLEIECDERNTSAPLELWKEYTHTTPDGRKARSIVIIDDCGAQEEMQINADNGKACKVRRVVSNGGNTVTETVTINGVTAVRIYERCQKS